MCVHTGTGVAGLDEAQMVDNSTSSAAEMAAVLHSVNRWCVTGTPFSRGVADAYGLLRFLRAMPYTKHVFGLEIQHPMRDEKLEPPNYPSGSTRGKGAVASEESAATGGKVAVEVGTARLATYLARLLWRNTKANVREELNLPRQHTVVETCRLDAIGQYHYKRLHADCAKNVHASIAKNCTGADGARMLCDLDQQTTQRVLGPLRLLRQACSHPAVAKGSLLGQSTGGGGRRGAHTMTAVVGQLIARARRDCFDHFQQMIFFWNGLAALHVLENDYTAAVEKYQDVIDAVDRYANEFTVDRMQLLHALLNLADALTHEHREAVATPLVASACDDPPVAKAGVFQSSVHGSTGAASEGSGNVSGNGTMALSAAGDGSCTHQLGISSSNGVMVHEDTALTLQPSLPATVPVANAGKTCGIPTRESIDGGTEDVAATDTVLTTPGDCCSTRLPQTVVLHGHVLDNVPDIVSQLKERAAVEQHRYTAEVYLQVGATGHQATCGCTFFLGGFCSIAAIFTRQLYLLRTFKCVTSYDLIREGHCPYARFLHT